MRDEDVRRIRARPEHAEEALREAVVVLPGLADGALAAADPRVDDPLRADRDALRSGPSASTTPNGSCPSVNGGTQPRSFT